jgi:hypothetical protein
MRETRMSQQDSAGLAFIAVLVGAIAFLAPHLYFLLVRGQATFFNPPTSLRPTILALGVGSTGMAALSRAPGVRSWLSATVFCEIGAMLGNVGYLVYRGTRGDDLNPLALRSRNWGSLISHPNRGWRRFRYPFGPASQPENAGLRPLRRMKLLRRFQ